MFLGIKKQIQTYTRSSKLGIEHQYQRTQTVASFACDQCGSVFERLAARMDRSRFSNEYHHVCPNCDQKRFAQSKGVERRRFWNTHVDSDIDITKI